VAGGAAFAMMLAGLGIAAAQTGDETPTTTAPSADPAEGGTSARPAPGPGHHRHPRIHAALDAAAEAIGISEADLRAAHRDGQSIAQVAEAKGVDVQQVIDAMVADVKAKLAKAVADGRITQARADEVSANLVERVTNLVNRVPADRDDAGRPGPGRPGEGARIHARLSVAAGAIGISEGELRTSLMGGQSIAQVAAAKGVDVQKVIDALAADAKAELAKAVAAGRITQARADEMGANVVDRVTALVNRTPPADGPGPGRRGPGHRFGPGDAGPDGDAPQAEPEVAPASTVDA
jgi:prolyl-tRNA editing enzyme YbaK/EbsC (Cys-tRNA(Pro) deacylase)